MQLSKPKTLRRRSARPRTAPAAGRRSPEPEPRQALSVSQVRARRGGGPEDRALYSCECGFVWTDEVTASPGCPHCGLPQAW